MFNQQTPKEKHFTSSLLLLLVFSSVAAASGSLVDSPNLISSDTLGNIPTNSVPSLPIAEADIQRVLNLARREPKSLIPHLKEIIAKFEGDLSIRLGANFYQNTYEGVSAWREAVAFLEKQKTL